MIRINRSYFSSHIRRRCVVVVVVVVVVAVGYPSRGNLRDKRLVLSFF